jgi:hypothetical protein
MKQKWIDEDSIYFPTPGNTAIHETPGSGIWQVVTAQNPHDNRLGLVKLSDKFEFTTKVYNLGISEFKDRVKKVWNSDIYVKNDKNLGIILNGFKGTGKSWFAKILCNELGMPVVIVNDSFDGRILDFIQNLNFECTVLIDEAEKTFKKDDGDEILLKLIDGIYNESRKLYILITNTLNVNENLLGRPGRIRYIQEFKNLPIEVINAYIDDNLKDLSLKSELLEKIDLLEISTIDILRSLVEEYNIFGKIERDSPLNITLAKYAFDAVFFQGCRVTDIPKIKEIFKEYKKDSKVDILNWLTMEADEDDRINRDIFEDKISSCSYVYTTEITSSFSKFWKDTSTSRGIVITEPDSEGYMVIKDESGAECVVLILQQLTAPSLYNGLLV